MLLTSFVVDVVAMGFGMPRALFPDTAHSDFGGPPSGGLAFALLYAAIPAGAVLGGIFSGWVSRVDRTGAAVCWAIAVWGALRGRLQGVFVGIALVAVAHPAFRRFRLSRAAGVGASE